MNITKKDAISVVAMVQYQNVSKIKKLDQKERKFILEAIKVAESDTILSKVKEIRETIGEIGEMNGRNSSVKSDPKFTLLKDKIKEKLDSSEVKARSNFIVRFFKGFANIFLCRKSSMQIIKAIKITQENSKNSSKYLQPF